MDSNNRFVCELKVGDTFSLYPGETLIVRENITGSCDKCYFDSVDSIYDCCPLVSCVNSRGRFENILSCEYKDGKRTVYYENVENHEDEEE